MNTKVRLGDWFRVIQLAQSTGGSEDLTQRAWTAIGEYYAGKQRWQTRMPEVLQKGSMERLHTYF
jgi:hypothetical protein